MSSFPSLQPPQQITDISQNKQDNSLWLKVFLIDSSSNINEWKASEEFIKKNVQNFVGKPFIITADKKHPDFVKEGVVFGKGQETIDQILTAQSKYKIGEIKKVDNSGNQWFAYIQIDNPRIIDSFKQGNIPKFVSPSVFDPNGTKDGTKMQEFSPLHIAAVDEPAYGLKAYTRGSCDGDSEKCLNELKSAANDQKSGGPTDPNCPCSILETFSNKFDIQRSSSYLKNASLSQNSLSQLEKPETIVAEITPQIETSKLEQATSDTNTQQSTPSTPQTTPQVTPEVAAPTQPETTEAPSVEKRGRKAAYEGELESVKQQLAQVLEWQKGEQEKAVKAAAEAQRATIEAAITPEVVGGDEAKRSQVIENLVGLNFSEQQLQFVLDLIGGNKGPKPQEKEQQPSKQAPPQFGKNQVKSASVNTLVLNQKQNQPKVNTSYVGFFGDL